MSVLLIEDDETIGEAVCSHLMAAGEDVFWAKTLAEGRAALVSCDVVILDGGFPKGLAEGRPVEEDAPQPRQPRSFTARLDNAAVADADGAGRGGFETGDHAQRRRLAAAGRPDQHHEFPVRDLQIERRDDGDGPEGLGDLLQTDLGHAATPSL